MFLVLIGVCLAGFVFGWTVRGIFPRGLHRDVWLLIEAHEELKRENAALRRQISRVHVPYVRVERGH
jgi:hypothetical protein